MRCKAIWQGIKRGFGFVLLAAVAALGAAADTVGEPEIVPRSAWGAKPARKDLMTPQTPHAIVIHHTSTRRQPKLNLEQKLRGLQSFSQAPGRVNDKPKPAWGDVPYHFYVDAAGRIGEGRDISYAGDSNTKYNTADRIQIVVEGNFEQEQPTQEQLRALDQLVIWLAAKYRVPPSGISGHNDLAPTDCPGRNLKDYLPQLRDKVAKASPPG